MVEYSWAR